LLLAAPALLAGCGLLAPAPSQGSAPGNFALSVTPPSATQFVGKASTYQLAVQGASGFQNTVSVSAQVTSGTASDVTISPNPVQISGNASAPVQITIDQAGAYKIVFTATSGNFTSQATLNLEASSTAGVAGVLTDGSSGAALAGAEIDLLSSSDSLVAQTSTDSNGFYSFNAPPGDYTVLSPGQQIDAPLNQGGSGPIFFASSQVVGVQIQAGSIAQQNLIQVHAASQSLSATPPQIALSGFNGTASNSSDLSVSGSVTDTALPSGLNGPQSGFVMMAAVNHDPFLFGPGSWLDGNPTVTVFNGQAIQNGVSDFSASLPLGKMAAGVTGNATLEIATVDANFNRTLLLVPLQLSGGSGASLSAAVSGLQAVALTVNDTRAQLFSVSPQSAPSGTNLFVALNWLPYSFPVAATAQNPYPGEGYDVYRSVNGGPSTLVASLPYYYSFSNAATENPFSWNDPSSSLAPNVPVSYQVVAFDGSQMAPGSSSAQTTPLPAFSVTLTGPADNATGVSTTPAFSWQTNGIGQGELFVPVYGDTIQGGSTFNSCGVATNPVSASQAGFTPSALWDELQNATLFYARGFAVGAPCGVVGGTAATSYGFTYTPGSVSGTTPPLEFDHPYQWQLFEAVAYNQSTSGQINALSVYSDAGQLFWTYGTGLFLSQTLEGDQVYTFTTGSN
jgi:hypothetical protein